VGVELTVSATGKDQYGDTFPLDDPVWSATGDGAGSFEPGSGLTITFTATYPGEVTVSCVQNGVTGTATIDVTGDDPELETITISPATAELRVGDELELVATGLDQYGWAFDLTDASWRFGGSGDGRFEPEAGDTTTFTATAEGDGVIVCAADGVEGIATVEIGSRALPAPRKILRRVTP
jgi:plastocyanin